MGHCISNRSCSILIDFRFGHTGQIDLDRTNRTSSLEKNYLSSLVFGGRAVIGFGGCTRPQRLTCRVHLTHHGEVHREEMSPHIHVLADSILLPSGDSSGICNQLDGIGSG